MIYQCFSPFSLPLVYLLRGHVAALNMRFILNSENGCVCLHFGPCFVIRWILHDPPLQCCCILPALPVGVPRHCDWLPGGTHSEASRVVYPTERHGN